MTAPSRGSEFLSTALPDRGEVRNRQTDRRWDRERETLRGHRRHLQQRPGQLQMLLKCKSVTRLTSVWVLVPSSSNWNRNFIWVGSIHPGGVFLLHRVHLSSLYQVALIIFLKECLSVCLICALRQNTFKILCSIALGRQLMLWLLALLHSVFRISQFLLYDLRISYIALGKVKRPIFKHLARKVYLSVM